MPFNYEKIEPVTPSEKMNPIGAVLIADYLTCTDKYGQQSARVNYPIFLVNNPEEVLFIIASQPTNTTYGIAMVSNNAHYTPIVIKGRDVTLLESLGVYQLDEDFRLQKVFMNTILNIFAIAQLPELDKAEKQAKGENTDSVETFNFYVPKTKRQFDLLSCGTDAFVVLEEAFKMGESFLTYVKNHVTILPISYGTLLTDGHLAANENETLFKLHQFSDLPPDIAKYTQSFSHIKTSSQKDKLVQTESKEEKMTVEQFAQLNKRTIGLWNPEKPGLHSKTVNLSPTQSETVLLKHIKLLETNGALMTRRREQQEVMKDMLKKLSTAELVELVKQKYGITTMLAHPERLTKFLIAFNKSHAEPPKILDNLDQAIETFVQDQIHSQRDNDGPVSGNMPVGRVSLSSIALTIANTYKNELEEKRAASPRSNF